jgi:hypothetical protein
MKTFTRTLAFGKTRTEVPSGIKTKRGILFDNDGWVIQSQFLSQTSRLVYVSVSGGDDATANSNQYGRSYYLPTDPVIGPDPTQPIGPINSHQSLLSAYTAARCIPTGTASRFPDWVLFKRGDTFDFSTLVSGNPYPGSRFLSESTHGGPSFNQRRVFGAYGDIAIDRPKISNANNLSGIWGRQTQSNYYIFSLEFLDTSPYGTGFAQVLYGPKNILLEDIKMEAGGLGTNQTSEDQNANFIIRRCVATSAYRLAETLSDGTTRDPHVQGFFTSATDINWVSECIIDMCGYKENPRKPSTWTAGVTSSGVRGELPAGNFSTQTNGVQPTRTFFDRNCYLSSYRELDFEGNIISRGSGGGCVQMRVGGTARNNAFLWNQHAINMGSNEGARAYFQNGVIENNLVLHDDHMLPPGGYAAGFSVGVGEEEGAIIRSNLLLHFHRSTNGGLGMLAGIGIPASPSGAPKESSKIMYIDDNVAISKTNSIIVMQVTTPTIAGVQEAKIGRNAFVKLQDGAAFNGVSTSNTQFEIGTANTGGNSYYGNWREFANSAWQSSGKDTASTLYTTLESLGVALGWQANAWEKDIVSYMQHVDPTYVPDENVTVDFSAPIEYRRANAPNVWYVLQNSQLYGGGTGVNLTESDAKLTARRYHATITFLNRAKANRKGSWDEDYTANSINNYFRTQFNKPLVTKSL